MKKKAISQTKAARLSNLNYEEREFKSLLRQLDDLKAKKEMTFKGQFELLGDPSALYEYKDLTQKEARLYNKILHVMNRAWLKTNG